MKLHGVLLAASLSAWPQVSPERIRNADREPGNWLTYSRTFNGHRFTPLNQITTANAGRLAAAWTWQTQQPGKFSTSPIVIDGILYITEPGGEVVAIDGRTGRPVWRYGRRPPPDLHACCGASNRGMAVLNDLLFDCGNRGRGIRYSWIPRRVRRQDRPPRVALLDHPRPWRAGTRIVAG